MNDGHIITGARHDPSDAPRRIDEDALKPLPRAGRLEPGEQALRLIGDVSRRIEVLARELNVLGHFDNDDDSPRAA